MVRHSTGHPWSGCVSAQRPGPRRRRGPDVDERHPIVQGATNALQGLSLRTALRRLAWQDTLGVRRASPRGDVSHCTLSRPAACRAAARLAVRFGKCILIGGRRTEAGSRPTEWFSWPCWQSILGKSRVHQAAATGRITVGSSPRGAMVSSVM